MLELSQMPALDGEPSLTQALCTSSFAPEDVARPFLISGRERPYAEVQHAIVQCLLT